MRSNETTRPSPATVAARKAIEIASLPLDSDIRIFGPRIVEIMRGVDYEVFRILDEEPGRFGYMAGHFFQLRQVRNDTTHGYGKAMFEGFAK